MTRTYKIRLALPADTPLLPAVELAAAKLYLSQLEITGLTPAILAKANSAEDFAAAQRANLLWVVVDETDSPVGFALLAQLDQWLHLDELDVHPAHGQRGVGTALVQQVCRWAKEQGYPGVTLSTFRHVVWNAPFYGRLGFVELPPAAQTPGLRALVAGEQERGLHTDLRLVMWHELKSETGE
jgi:GNAT superfamily N-acetyltransferase